jgi:alanyl-tRNA synthetase
VVARDFSAEERARLPLRKEPVKGDRVVLVEGVDASPCGGTHPRSTGEVGAIAVLRAQKWGSGKARVEFVCGNRVVRALGDANAALQTAADAFKCAVAEVGQAAQRASQESLARRKASEALETELSGHLAAQLAASTPLGPVVTRLVRSSQLARSISQALASLGRVALVATIDEGRAHLCFARPKGQGPAMNDLLKVALGVLGGKGGGSPDFATGSGEPGKLDDALTVAAARAAAT